MLAPGRLHRLLQRHPRRGHHLQLRGQRDQTGRPRLATESREPQVQATRGGDPRHQVCQRRDLHPGGVDASFGHHEGTRMICVFVGSTK